MKYFEFDNCVKIICGDNALQDLAKIVLDSGGRRCLLISDKNLQKLGKTAQIIKLLAEKEVAVGAIFIEAPPAPNFETIRELYKIYRSNGCDSIVACGSAVVLEIAKGLKLLLSTRSKNLLDCRGVNNIKNYINIPFVTVPTSGAGGVDVCKISLIKDDKSGRLMDFDTTAQLPQFTVLQPDITLSNGAEGTASVIVEILAHSIEAYCGLNYNPISQSFCSRALSLVFKNVDKLMTNLKDVEARLAIMQAQTLSSLGFGNSKSGIMHAIAYAINEVYGTPYSHGLTAVMSKCLQFNLSVNKDKYANLSYYVVGEEKYVQIKAEERAESFLQKIDETISKFCKNYNMPTCLADMNVDLQKLSELAFRAYTESAVVTNAKSVEMNDILQILEECKGGVVGE